jgi:hypothetical protein
VIGIWGPYVLSGINWEWYNEAMDKIAGGIVQAYRAMEPAGLKFGHGEAAGFSRDSREPIIMEEQVETIQAVNLGGETVATMVFFASHPEVLWDQNTLLTSDYPNYLYQYVEANVGGTAVFISGPLGGLITPIVENHDFDDAQKFGEAVADIALTSLQNEPVIWETQLRAEIREIFVPLTNPVFRAAALIGMLERPLYHMRKDVLSAVSVMEFGENGNLAQIVTVPGEDFPENWFEIKSKLHAEHRIHIGLCMDELGYIVPIEEFNWKNYEESMSASRFMDPIVHKNLEDMLKIIK